MRAKSLLVILAALAMPLVFGQMCASAPEEPEAPIVEPITPVIVPPVVVPVVPPTDPVTTPSVIMPPLVVPPVVVPPVVVPPVTPPQPPTWQPKIIDSVEVPTKTWKRALTAEEIGYVWLFPCNGIIHPPTSDPNGPDSTRLYLDDNGPVASYHNVFCRFPIDETVGETTTALLNLFCLDNSSDGEADASAIGISRILANWDSQKTFAPPWQIYCEPDSSFSDYLGSYEPNGPSINEWYSLDITEPYQKWFSGEGENFGLMLEQGGWWNRFTSFASAQYSDESKRPWLLVYHRPALQLKLPLPGGKAWILTTEAGGNHSNALDLSYSSAKLGIDGKPKTTTETDVPILAAGEGVVIAAKEDDGESPNGGYVKIKHQPEGYVTCYLHLKPSSVKVKVDDCLAQGAQLGLMGTTGNSTGVHIHFEVQWVGKGVEAAVRLAGVTVEGRPFGDFKVGNDGDNYYTSTNLP